MRVGLKLFLLSGWGGGALDEDGRSIQLADEGGRYADAGEGDVHHLEGVGEGRRNRLPKVRSGATVRAWQRRGLTGANTLRSGFLRQ